MGLGGGVVEGRECRLEGHRLCRPTLEASEKSRRLSATHIVPDCRYDGTTLYTYRWCVVKGIAVQTRA